MVTKKTRGRSSMELIPVQIDVREKEHEDPNFQDHSLLFEYTSDNLSRIILKASNGYTPTVYPG